MGGRNGADLARVTPPAALPGLARKRRLALAALWVERVWPAIWPAVGVIGLYLAASLADAPALLPPVARLPVLAVVVLVAAILLWRGLRRVVWPSTAEADRRLERDGNLPHRPLAALSDRPASPTPEQEALWRVHLARLARTVPRLTVRQPRPGLARRDPFALRGALVVVLVAAAAGAGADAPGRLARGFMPQWPTGPAGPGTQIQGWVTPPAYTGLPPTVLPTLPLRADAATPRVPAGSRLTVGVTGSSGEPSLAVGDAAEPFRALDATSWQAERDLGTGTDGQARVEVRRSGRSIGQWTLALIPDQPPVPGFSEPPGPAVAEGRPTLATRFAWQATDDYGVASLRIEMRLAARPDAPPLVVAVPLGGAPKTARGATAPNLSAHPWAGLPVVARLVATDAPGQTGRSEPAALTLPAREFQNPVARALIATRRQLSLTPEERRAARAVIDGIADDPASVDDSTGVLLNLRALAALLTRGRDQAAVDEAQARMWTLALALEEEAPQRTAEALERARDAVKDAMEPERPTEAQQAEIDRRVQELREAIQKHMEALAEQARKDGTTVPLDPNLPQMNARDLDRLAQQLQQSLKDGKTEDAKKQMVELEKLLDALKNARPQTAEERQQQRAEQRQRGREQMSAVQDMVQREGQLLDRSERRTPEPLAPGQRPPGFQRPNPGAPPQAAPPQAGSAPNGTAEQRAGDAKAQAAMRRALGELMQRFGDLTGDVPAPLGEADQAMREAGQALADGRDGAASNATKRAIEALQKGGQQMGQQMAQQFGTGQPGGEGEEGEGDGDGQGLGSAQNGEGRTTGPRPGSSPGSGQRRSADRDPLGRPLDRGTSGRAESGDVRIPDEMEQARTRALQDELRRRGSDRTRQQNELDYIDRLLNPF